MMTLQSFFGGKKEKKFSFKGKSKLLKGHYTQILNAVIFVIGTKKKKIPSLLKTLFHSF